jgi:hypothetical protein
MHMNTPQTYTTSELAAISATASIADLFKSDGAIKVLVKPTIISEPVRAISPCQVVQGASPGSIFGFAEGFVSASCNECAAFAFENDLQFHNSLRGNMGLGASKDSNEGSMRTTISKPNNHSRIVHRKKPAPPGALFAGREFLNLITWKRVSPTKMIVSFNPTEHDDVPPNANYVRATNQQYVEFTEISPGRTRVRTYYHANLGGRVPTYFSHYVVPRYTIDAVKECLTYFQHLIPFDKMTEIEGRDAGDLLMDKVVTAQRKVGWKHKLPVAAREVDEFFERNSALKQMQVLYPSFKSIITAVAEQRGTAPTIVKAKLADLTKPEASKIGSLLKGEIIVHVNSHTAVDLWIMAQPILLELDSNHVWFRPFMYAVGLRIIKTSDWGMKARVMFGSGLSLFDMVSDIYMIYLFFAEDNTAFAIATLSMIIFNMLVQLTLVFINTAGMKRSTKVREVMFVLLCIKPGVDAYRISIDWEFDEKQKFEPLHEMLISKGGETATESLPASVLQMFALLKATKRSNAAIASIVISVLTTAFTATIMTFDYDLSPKKRAATPEIYGFVRTNARTVTLLLLFTSTVFHVTNKVLACGLVAAVSPSLLFKFLAADILSMVVIKVLRGDFVYASLPNSLAGLIVSFMERTFSKLLVDFTGFMQGRHPYEMGGAYWVWSMVITQLSALAAAWYYNVMNKGVVGGLDERTVWKIVGGISALWLISFIWLMRTIDPKYLPTFYQRMTAKQFTIKIFRNADTDEKKALIFKRSFHLWRSIEGEVRTWVHANFAKWEADKPAWWTEKLIQKIPEEVLTRDERASLFSGGKKERRGSSLLEDVGLVNLVVFFYP